MGENVAAFDTLAAARRMEAAGMNRDHAEAVAETAREAAGSHGADVATKADLAKDIAAAVEPLSTKADVAAMETRLTVRIVGFLLVITGLLLTVLFRLP